MAISHVFPGAAPACTATQSAQFAELVAPFVSRDSHGFFTLWSGAIAPDSAAVVKPSRLSADEITSWAPTMLYVGRGGTIAHKTFPASPWGNSFKVLVFGRTQAIKHHSYALVQDPLKRAPLANVRRQGAGLSLPGT